MVTMGKFSSTIQGRRRYGSRWELAFRTRSGSSPGQSGVRWRPHPGAARDASLFRLRISSAARRATGATDSSGTRAGQCSAPGWVVSPPRGCVRCIGRPRSSVIASGHFYLLNATFLPSEIRRHAAISQADPARARAADRRATSLCRAGRLGKNGLPPARRNLAVSSARRPRR